MRLSLERGFSLVLWHEDVLVVMEGPMFPLFRCADVVGTRTCSQVFLLYLVDGLQASIHCAIAALPHLENGLAVVSADGAKLLSKNAKMIAH